MVEHPDQPFPAHVPFARPVDGIAERHVVGRHRLGDRSRRAADTEEPAGDLLAGANLGEGAIGHRIDVDGERLSVRIDRIGSHRRAVSQ